MAVPAAVVGRDQQLLAPRYRPPQERADRDPIASTATAGVSAEVPTPICPRPEVSSKMPSGMLGSRRR
jgi:hypothetical protein